MNNISLLHTQLTGRNLPKAKSKDLVLRFAKDLGWNPSYFIPSAVNEKSNGYLVIEHGLENSAIISFLNVRNEDLNSQEEESILGLSYNNLVDWHITIDERYINYYFVLNKDKKLIDSRKIVVGNEYEALNVNTFSEIIKKKPNANLKALDDVLIENLSYWKRFISAELNNNLDLTALSHLFNSIIFLRSIEDNNKRKDIEPSNNKILLSLIFEHDLSISDLIHRAEEQLITIPEFIVDKKNLKIFNGLSYSDIKRLIGSFYENDYNRFKYDFSIITKQALSRIYQKYVSLLHVSNTSEYMQSLFGFSEVPIEILNKDGGAFYTPEYIARFFSKYISKTFISKEFNNIKILDPAVGSGIFLRTLLETEIENRIENKEELNIDNLFENVYGIDIDLNACLATKLSLTLLHHNFNENIIEPKIFNSDALKNLEEISKSSYKYFDVIISNPPYISQNRQSTELSIYLKEFLGSLTNGKVDTYHAFLKLSIDMLKDEGIGLFVLPHNFLISESSKKLRNYILDTCIIEVLADLSAINVFENVNTYTMLLILRKKGSHRQLKNNSWLLKCKASPGEALNHILNENEIENNLFQIYSAYDYFQKDKEWFILTKSEFNLFSKINNNKPIAEFLNISQGIVTGNDKVFLRDNKKISKREKKIYKNFVADKEITPYSLNRESENAIFFPFIDDEIITEKDLSEIFPETWDYLNSKKVQLEDRYKAKKGSSWWKLHSTGKATEVNSPKIITPYLSISPKFSLDINGDFITSRSNYFTLKDKTSDVKLLFYFLGILNSIPCYWYLSLQSHKQASGYNIFPITLFRKTPIPDPTKKENISLVNKMILAVQKRFIEKDFSKQYAIEREINLIASDLYDLNNLERELLGLDGD